MRPGLADLGGQGIAILLTLMTGVALDMGFLVSELMVWPNWEVGGGGGWQEAGRGLNPTDRSHQAWGDLLG